MGKQNVKSKVRKEGETWKQDQGNETILGIRALGIAGGGLFAWVLFLFLLATAIRWSAIDKFTTKLLAQSFAIPLWIRKDEGGRVQQTETIKTYWLQATIKEAIWENAGLEGGWIKIDGFFKNKNLIF